jgi:hypothetical protein
MAECINTRKSKVVQMKSHWVLVWVKEQTPLKMVPVVSKAGISLMSPANRSSVQRTAWAAAGVTATLLSLHLHLAQGHPKESPNRSHVNNPHNR